MSEIIRDAKNSNIEITDSLGVNLSGTNSRIKHTGTGTLNISSSGTLDLGNTNNSNVTIGSVSSDLTMTNTDNNTQYIYMNYSATPANRWRIFVGDTGKLTFSRFDGSSWVAKFEME